jgi:hypothetical protein
MVDSWFPVGYKKVEVITQRECVVVPNVGHLHGARLIAAQSMEQYFFIDDNRSIGTWFCNSGLGVSVWKRREEGWRNADYLY